ncbi:MAG: metallophosphoesterase [Rhizobiales bacterium]|nr:metallophosphoesterase [Hyphomicrobiales bacterium]
MSFTYVIPDIHGRDDLLSRALGEISAHASGAAGTIVTIGDYVDKGPQTRQVIERLLPGIGGGWRFVALKGNHDSMMIEGLRDPAKLAFWLARGGDTALASYGGDPALVPQTHLAWLDRLRLYHVDAHRLYVHAGIDPASPLEMQSEETLLWKRYPKDDSGGFGERHVVHGHDNDPDGPQLLRGRSNLDTAAWKTGRLTIGVFDDERPGGPVDLIVVQGATGR